MMNMILDRDTVQHEHQEEKKAVVVETHVSLWTVWQNDDVMSQMQESMLSEHVGCWEQDEV